MSEKPVPRSPTPEEVAALLAKQKPRPWEKVRSSGLFHWHSTVKVREYWEPFYQHLADSLEPFFLESPLRETLVKFMRDGTAGRRNAGFQEFLGAYDSNGRYEHAGSTVAKALPRVRGLLAEQYLHGIAVTGASRNRLYQWAVTVLRVGDQMGLYPNDHDVQTEFSGPGDVAGVADRAGDAMFAMFVRTVCEFVPVAGYVTMSPRRRHANSWFDRDNGYFYTVPDREPFTAGYHWGLFVPNGDVEALGGRERFVSAAPVEEVVVVEPVDGSPSPGLAVRLTRKISDITDERVTQWREFLDPVIDIKAPTEVRSRLERPVDVLDSDWSAVPDSPNPATA